MAVLTVGSSFPTALNIASAPSKDKDGKAVTPDPIWINPAFGISEGITTGVDAKAFKAWTKANPEHPAVVNGSLRVLNGNIDHAWDTEPEGAEAPLPTALPLSEPAPEKKPAAAK